MENENYLKINSKKEWFMCLLLGFFIGLAVVAPGISGATIAIIFGLYAKLLYSFDNLFKKFKNCFLFLLPVGIGLVIGFVFGFFVVQKVFELIPFIIICLFAGLMIGSFPAVKDEIKNVKFDASKISLFIIGVIIPIIIGIISVIFTDSSSEPINASIPLIISYFIIGFFVSLTQLVPGLSCSAILMALGQFGSILASVHLDYLLENPMVIVALGSLAIGFILGIIVFSKIINKLIEKKRDATYSTIVGLSLGSIVSMLVNPEIFAVYKSWTSFNVAFLDIVLGLILMAVGIVVTYALVRYQRKKDLENNNTLNSDTENEKNNQNL